MFDSQQIQGLQKLVMQIFDHSSLISQELSAEFISHALDLIVEDRSWAGINDETRSELLAETLNQLEKSGKLDSKNRMIGANLLGNHRRKVKVWYVRII